MRRTGSNNRTILLLGSSGMLGQELKHVFQSARSADLKMSLICRTSMDLDIADLESVRKALQEVQPDIVMNAAAYTDVDGCEKNKERAERVNGLGPAYLAEACRDVSALLVHFGSDYVFDGLKDQPYRCADIVNPLSQYGRSKWSGERAILQSECKHLIVRTSWLFGGMGRNFVEAILTRANAGEPLRVVDDQVGCPTYAVDLALAVAELLARRATGVFHFTNSGYCSWHEFAVEILRRAKIAATVTAISTAELNRPAPRPAYSVLDCSRYIDISGKTPPSWQDALQRYLQAKSQKQDVQVSMASR